jgi:O-succinylbenzoic acid--CoA ligase
VTELVALDLPLGPALYDEIRRAHDRGHAVSVIDQRLSPSRRVEVLTRLAPTLIVTANGDRARVEGTPVEPGDGLVIATSGTSGPPKFAVLTWSSIIAGAELTSRELHRGLPTCWLTCLPPVHIGGFAVLARSLFADDRLVYADPQQLDQGPRLGATHVAVVRAQLARFDLSEYHVVLLGGGRAPAELPGNVVTTWGMTETGAGVVYNGRALPEVDVAIVDGEVIVRSPTLLRTYRYGPVTWVRGPDGRADWLATGDEGELHGDHLTVFGRRSSVIVTGGEKVWPEDLEAILAQVDGVIEVAVVGADDPEWGQRVVAVVVASRSSDELLSAFAEVATEAIGPWAKPKEIRKVPALPRTDSGKVRRDVLGATS